MNDNRLSPDSHVALYYQLKQSLMARIRAEEWADHRFPSEAELCSEYDVSRVTVRRALSELERDGYIMKQQGRGTVIVARRIDSELDKVISFTQQALIEGHIPSVIVLECRKRPASPAIASRLCIAPNAPICYLRRIRCLDGMPVLIEETHLPLSLFPDIHKVDFNQCHLYEIMRDRYGMNPDAWKESHSAILLTPEEAGHLRVEMGTPALRTEQYTYACDDLVEFTVTIVNTAIYQPRVWVGTPR